MLHLSFFLFFFIFAEPRKKTKAQHSRAAEEESRITKAITDDEIEMQPEFRVTKYR